MNHSLPQKRVKYIGPTLIETWDEITVFSQLVWPQGELVVAQEYFNEAPHPNTVNLTSHMFCNIRDQIHTSLLIKICTASSIS